MAQKSEEEFIIEMKEAIKDTTLEVSEKVNKSALLYMTKKGWVSDQDINDLDKFFAKKIPQVLSDEISKNLNTVLGLDLKL